MLKDKRVVAAIESSADMIVHSVNVGLVDRDALFGESRCIVDGYAVQLRVGSPVLVQKQEQLLSSAKHKDRQENTASSLDDVVDLGGESMLLVEAWFVGLCTIGGFADENVGLDGRDFSLDEVPILLAAKVARVQDAKACDLDEEHACTQNVACMIGGEAETTGDRDVLVKINSLDLAPRSQHLVFVKQVVVVARITDPNKVRHKEAVDGFGGMRHVDFAVAVAEIGLFHDVGESGGMVKMEVCDENGIDSRPVKFVNEGKCSNSGEGRMNARVTDDGLAPILEDAAGATDLLACAEHLDCELIVGGRLQSGTTRRGLRNDRGRHVCNAQTREEEGVMVVGRIL